MRLTARTQDARTALRVSVIGGPLSVIVLLCSGAGCSVVKAKKGYENTGTAFNDRPDGLLHQAGRLLCIWRGDRCAGMLSRLQACLDRQSSSGPLRFPVQGCAAFRHELRQFGVHYEYTGIPGRDRTEGNVQRLDNEDQLLFIHHVSQSYRSRCDKSPVTTSLIGHRLTVTGYPLQFVPYLLRHYGA